MMTDVGVVIVNWNTCQYVLNCVESFLVNGVLAENLVVVDQGSTDGSVEELHVRFPQVHLLIRKDNRGYGFAVNTGAQLLSTKYIVVSNADVTVPSGTLSELRQAMIAHPSIALLGCHHRNTNGKLTTQFSRTTILRGMMLEFVPRRLRGTWRTLELRSRNTSFPQQVRYVEGAFLFLHHSSFDAVGGFDEGFSFFFEDVDLPMRLFNSGFEVRHIPSVHIIHRGGESFSQVPMRHKEEFYRNFLRLYKRHALRRAIWMRRIYALWFGVHAKLRCTIKWVFGGLSQSKTEDGQAQIFAKIANIYRPALFKKNAIEQPMVTVVIPTYNRPDCLLQLLLKLQFQNYKNYEVIVIDQSSECSVQENQLLHSLSYPITFLRSEYPNRSNAKNIGIRHAHGDIVLFCDDDITPPDDLLGVHVKYQKDETIGGVSCRIVEHLLPPLETPDICRITWYGRMKDGFQSNVHCDVGTLIGGNMSIRKKILNEIGYFDALYRGTSIFEEQDISERLKELAYRIYFTNDTTVQHSPQNSGNVALQQSNTAHYYRDFHHNELVFFLKNRNHLLILFVIPFCVLRTFKKTLQHHLSLSETYCILYGIVEGIISYYRSLKC